MNKWLIVISAFLIFGCAVTPVKKAEWVTVQERGDRLNAELEAEFYALFKDYNF